MTPPLMKKRSFLRSGEGAIASYSWTDMAEATGKVFYYLCSTHTDASDDYILTGVNLKSHDIRTDVTTVNVAYTKIIDFDFDLLFNVPVRIRGVANASISTALHNVANAGLYAIVKLRKWDGASETEIADGQSKNLSTAGGVVQKVFLLDIDLSTITEINVGDTLRVTVEIWAICPANTTTGSLMHDPADRDSTFLGTAIDTTQSYVTIPFILDL